MSKIPTPFSSNIVPVSRAKSVKRLNTAGSASPDKRLRGNENRRPPPAKRSTLTSNRLRRSISMNQLPRNSRATIGSGPSRSNAALRPIRSSNVTASTLASASRRPPAARGAASTVAAASSSQPTNKPTNGVKSKRPGWDLKGRLQDMEEYVTKSNKLVLECNDRIASLEQDKQDATRKVESLQCNTESFQGEIDSLKRELSSAMAEKRSLEFKLVDVERERDSLKRHVTSIESELDSAIKEKVALKASLDEITGLKVRMDAESEAMKHSLDSHVKSLTELKDTVAKQEETISDLNSKLMEGEMSRRRLHNMVQELKGNIRVFCRIRPLVESEEVDQGTDDVSHINILDDKSFELIKNQNLDRGCKSGLKSDNRSGSFEFSFDRVFGPKTNQEQVFDEVSQLVQSVLDGYNVCVFAYGQTGSGKTFTMEGSQDDPALEGIIPRTVKQIFETIHDLETNKGWQYRMNASYLEIYNETIRDLLADPSHVKSTIYDIRMADGKKNDVFVTNLKVIPLESASQAHDLLKIANSHRSIASTNMNERSSRSHSVFQLRLDGHNSKTQSSCQGTLNLIDLAGSERLKSSKSEGARLTETQNINTSLANLTNVIMALGQKQSHIPYRNSKLTYLLQNSLGGNSKTLMFINVSPLQSCFNESLNSLRFATKVNECHIGTARQVKK